MDQGKWSQRETSASAVDWSARYSACRSMAHNQESNRPDMFYEGVLAFDTIIAPLLKALDGQNVFIRGGEMMNLMAGYGLHLQACTVKPEGIPALRAEIDGKNADGIYLSSFEPIAEQYKEALKNGPMRQQLFPSPFGEQLANALKRTEIFSAEHGRPCELQHLLPGLVQQLDNNTRQVIALLNGYPTPNLRPGLPSA